MWMVEAIYIGTLTAQVSWLGLGVVLSLHSSNELGELLQWLWS